MTIKDIAMDYLNAGLCVLPARLQEKHPTVAWKAYQSQRPTELQIQEWFSEERPLCVLTGDISGNLELLDFDQGGELFGKWVELVISTAPTLIDRLVIEQSQSGGKHVVYRCQASVPGNHKLAERRITVESPDPVTIRGKVFQPRRVGQHYEIKVTLIETRGEGGLFLCAPTKGYVLQQGSLTAIPVLSEAERELLVEAAQALNESFQPTTKTSPSSSGSGRPGDDFNERGDVQALLRRHGWELVRSGENEYWRRPGKDQGWSATLRDRVLYVFSSNAAPFDPDRAYGPFSVSTLLEHAGDFAAAASALRTQGFGDEERREVDLSGIIRDLSYPQTTLGDPGPLPEVMYRVPGFVSELMDHCLETAPYPNVPLAFCGALALQAMLAGRKVRDSADNRTNLYLLALAHSSVGKDWPRKVNAAVLHQVGLVDALGEKFASGEGIQDSLFRTPSMLFQTDEMDGLLQSISKAHDARHENILGTLLTMYSVANSVFPMRRKAGAEASGLIYQPCLVIYGTAIPNHYYAALCERLLTNGFFARTLIVESGPRSRGQEPSIIAPPARVLSTARWWAEFIPGSGDLINCLHPQPRVVQATKEAHRILTESRQASETEYAKAESRDDAVGTTVWGRAPEQIRKLALLYSVSSNHEKPEIDEAAARWATEFILHHTRRMLFMASSHVADNPFHALCLKLLGKLRSAPGQKLPHSVLLKRMKIESKVFNELITTLKQQGDISEVTISRTGAAIHEYHLLEGVKPEVKGET